MVDNKINKEILDLIKLAIDSGISKEEFIKFLEEQKTKNTN
jgi:hypothetical protein